MKVSENNEILLTNCIVINPEESVSCSLLVKNKKIALMGDINPDHYPDALVINVKNKPVFPGLIDISPILHQSLDSKNSGYQLNYETSLALKGGITSIVDTLCTSNQTKIKKVISHFEKNSLCNFSFHIAASEDFEAKKTIFDLVNAGLLSFKFSFCSDVLPEISDDKFFELIKEIQNFSAIASVKPHSDSLIKHFEKTDDEYYYLSSPAILERECVNKTLLYNEVAESQICFQDISLKKTFDQIQKYSSTNHRISISLPYLLFNKFIYFEPESHRYRVLPPFRSEDNIDYLWKNLLSNPSSIISSGHFIDTEDFIVDEPVFTKDFYPGLPIFPYFLPLLYTYGVEYGRITLNDISRLASLNPAKLLGFSSEKGSLSPGKDAELCVFDCESRTTIVKNLFNPFLPF